MLAGHLGTWGSSQRLSLAPPTLQGPPGLVWTSQSAFLFVVLHKLLSSLPQVTQQHTPVCPITALLQALPLIPWSV